MNKKSVTKAKNQRVSTLSREDLPLGWALATINEIVAHDGVFSDGDWVISKDQDPNGDVRLIQLADIGDGVYRNRSSRYLTYAKAIELGCTFLEANDILIARMPDPLGRACIFPGDPKHSVTAVDVCIVRTGTGGANHRWLMHTVNSPATRVAIESLQSGTTRKRISRRNLAQIELPLPPLAEQNRIAAKIEALFAQSRAAQEALEAVPDLIAKFRQAVLAAAFRGVLVEQDPNDEPAPALLKRIRAERRRKWEEDLRAQGKDPNRRKYKEPQPPDTFDLPELPEGWVWTILDILTEVRGGVTKGRDLSRFETIEVPYLRVANVQSGYLDLEEVKTIQIKASELEKHRLRPNDILFTEGGDRDKLGRGTVWQGEVEVCVRQNHVFAARPYSREVIPDWVSLASQTTYARDYFWDVARQTVNLASINMTKLKAFPVPIPPMQEQHRILARIKALFAHADALEVAATVALYQLEQTEQAILARAFRGDLVEQNPEDEPASILLTRIEQEVAQGTKTQEAKSADEIPESAEPLQKETESVKSPSELTELLNRLQRLSDKPVSPETLWLESKLEISEFYAFLKQEVIAGHIAEQRKGREVHLEVTV